MAKWACSHHISVIIGLDYLAEAKVRHWRLSQGALHGETSTFFCICTWGFYRGGVWDTEGLIHSDLELFIWLEVVNGQITTLSWYLNFFYVSCESKKKKKLIVIRIHLQKWFPFPQSTCQNSLSPWLACFVHSPVQIYFRRRARGWVRMANASFMELIVTRHSYSSPTIFRFRTPPTGRPAHLVHTSFSVRNLTFRF